MINKIKILGIMFLVSACGPKKVVNIDPQAQPYVDEFIRTSVELNRSIELSDLTVVFENTGTEERPHQVGYCQMTQEGENRTVALDIEFWDSASDALRLSLVFHELGHCLLFKDHKTDTENKSFMEPWLLSGKITEENWPELVSELFGSTKLVAEYEFGGTGNDNVSTYSLNNFDLEPIGECNH